MKILLVNKFLYPNGGSETYIFELGKELVRQGHEVQYFGMEHEGRVVGNHAESYTSNMDFHSGKLDKLLYPLKIVYSVEARQKIRKVLDDFSPDVVHLNNINFQLTPSIIYEIRAWEKHNHRVRIVFTAHDYQWVCPNHMLYIPDKSETCERCISGGYSQCTKNRCIHNSLLKSAIGTIEATLYHFLHTYRMVDKVIAPSRFMYDKLSSNKDIADRLIMLRNFVPGKVNSQKIENATGDYVLYFGRYDVQKGVLTLLKVCRELEAISFVFAGSGPLEQLVNQTENVANVGFVSGEELHRLIAEARFTVYPSEWYENCPFSVMESQILGTPVIGTDIGGIPELISTDDAPTGVLVEASNADALKDAISSLWSDEDRCRCYSKNCSQNKWDNLEEYTHKILGIYEDRD